MSTVLNFVAKINGLQQAISLLCWKILVKRETVLFAQAGSFRTTKTWGLRVRTTKTTTKTL